MRQEKARILWNTLECSDYYRMGLQCGDGYREAGPGQFVMVRLPDSMNPLLRRPFSLHRLVETKTRFGGIELLYKVVGTGTTKLSRLPAGETIDILGPLGNCFTIPETVHRAFVVAGGIGVAPMYFLTRSLGRKGVDLSACMVFIGGRSKGDLLCMNDFFSVGMDRIRIATEDGSFGEQDRITGPLGRAVADGKPDIIYACGPLPMLKAAADIAAQHGIPCQVSVETMMACGMGACLGCAMPSRENPDRFLHACTDGPVFAATALAL